MPGKNDEDLVSLIKKGDRDAFNMLVEKYQSKVINIAFGMLSSREDAYDAAQEVFIRLYKNIGSFKGNSAFSTWIYKITANICTDMLRRRMRSGNVISLSADTEEGTAKIDIRDESPTPEEHAQSTELQRLVRRAISELPDDYRDVIVLFDLMGMSYDEISEIVKCPIGTVKSRLSRARNLLKKKLSENRELF